MKVEMKLTGLDGVLETLKSLPPEIVSKRGGPARLALRKGIGVILKQAKANFRQAVEQPGKTGITDATGFTEKQIVVRRKVPPGRVNGEYAVITVRPLPHPNGKKYKRGIIKANDIAFIMEFGSSFQPATPWLMPAFNAKAEEAIHTVERELLAGIDRIVKKLARSK